MRDTTTIPRPYFRESTDALASLVATRPARDVLLSVAAELTYRERPAARRLASEVAALLGGVASIAPVAVAPVPSRKAEIAASWQAFDADPRIKAMCDAVDRLPADPPAKPARKPAAPAIGATSRQRRAFGALSEALREHLRAWDAWHAAWRQHRYCGGPNPGPEPIDTTSPEARERAARALRYEASAEERAKRDAAHLEYWGGDLAARDKAIRSAPKGDMADPAHVAKVKAHMAEASKAARDAAKAEAGRKARADAAHAEWNAARLQAAKPTGRRKATIAA